jgi:hypothetical protein
MTRNFVAFFGRVKLINYLERSFEALLPLELLEAERERLRE